MDKEPYYCKINCSIAVSRSHLLLSVVFHKSNQLKVRVVNRNETQTCISIEVKFLTFKKVTALNTIFKPSKVQKHTGINIYNALASLEICRPRWFCVYRAHRWT
jgi:hypothetical protein